jgi:integrase/recombinase XerD
LTDRAIDPVAAWMMVKRRLKDAGLSTIYSNHSFRAAGITNFLENGGNFEVAQRIASHAAGAAGQGR